MSAEPDALSDSDGDSADDGDAKEEAALRMRSSHRRSVPAGLPPLSPRVAWNSEEGQRQREQARLQAIEANAGGSPFAQSSWKPAPFPPPQSPRIGVV
jgi:hypothetical protein